MDYSEYKRQFQTLSAKANELFEVVKYDDLIKKEQELDVLMNKPDFWDDKDNSNKIIKEVKIVKDKISNVNIIKDNLDELEVHLELLEESNEYD